MPGLDPRCTRCGAPIKRHVVQTKYKWLSPGEELWIRDGFSSDGAAISGTWVCDFVARDWSIPVNAWDQEHAHVPLASAEDALAALAAMVEELAQ